MAYTIPVLALLIDNGAAAALIGEAADFFDDPDNDVWGGLNRLGAATGLPLDGFALEGGECLALGLLIVSDFVFALTPQLLAQEAALKAKHPHPLIQASTLGIASQFS